jgi:DNA mismatch endonuclease (patch repair protein)
MTDVQSPAVRSKNMQAIRSKNTRPEITVRYLLHAAGFRYRLHVSDLPGKPDLVFPKYRAVIMVNGCFWHGHDYQFFKLPSTRTDFWKQKIAKNRANDESSSRALRSADWRVAIVWECALRKKKADSFENVTQKLIDWLRSSEASIELPAAESYR